MPLFWHGLIVPAPERVEPLSVWRPVATMLRRCRGIEHLSCAAPALPEYSRPLPIVHPS